MWLCFKKVKEEPEDERHFLENGRKILEDLITYFDGKSNPIRFFTKAELQKATDNYNSDLILHTDLTYDLYKGIHEDRIISVKKFNRNDAQSYRKWYINEVAVASQLSNHKKILKVLGCCLETQVPILVYEFAPNGDLSQHIIEEKKLDDHPSLLSWESRLRIASEIADTITYLHTGISKPIIHRDVKSRNIFLDQNYVVKIFEFGLSLPVPAGETHVQAELAGTTGFLDPQSLSTGKFTEKSDVYGFGAVLLEIITGKRAYRIFNELYDVLESNDQDERKSKLMPDSKLRIEERARVTEAFLKANFFGEGDQKQMIACMELVLRCTKENPDGRPTMKDVAQELRRIRDSGAVINGCQCG